MTVLDASFYATHAFSADPEDPVDRWCQLPHSGNRASVQTLLAALGLGGPDRVLLDPFCGAGSTLLAGARRGGAVAGCDVEPGAVAATALKLAAPRLAAELRGGEPPASEGWRWAQGVCSLIDTLPGVAPPTLSRVLADCRRPQASFDGHGLCCTGAADALDALAPVLGGRTVDVFTSPPHGTGRASLWAGLDGHAAANLLADAPPAACVLPAAVVDPGEASRDVALDALGRTLEALRREQRLGRVAVEYEDALDRPPASTALAARLTGLGLAGVRRIELYLGSPDGLSGIAGGGLITGGGVFS